MNRNRESPLPFDGAVGDAKHAKLDANLPVDNHIVYLSFNADMSVENLRCV